jgi:hypothetical protein
VVRFYFHPTPTPAKVTLVLEERGLAYQVVPIDTSKRERHSPALSRHQSEREGPGDRRHRWTWRRRRPGVRPAPYLSTWATGVGAS